MFGETFCNEKVVRIDMRSFEDVRGLLSPIDFETYGFRPLRAFVVSAPSGSVRGGHGHRLGRQILMLVSGLIDVEIRFSGGTDLIRLDRERRALLIDPPVWSRQTYVGDHAAMVVFCDTAYDPEDYVVDVETPTIDGTSVAPSA